MINDELASADAVVGGSRPGPSSYDVQISIKEATKTFTTKSGPLQALDRVSADIDKGELVCIVGPSGCGKTTLLWAMAGLHALTSGQVVLEGEPVEGPRPDKIGMIFQDANLLPWRNVRRNLEFPFEIKRQAPARDRIAALLEQTGLTGFEAAFPRELSGGMQQRVSIVRALAQEPSVLLMDEPFGALDAFTRDEMNMLLLRLWSEKVGQTIVFVTHNISEAIFLAGRVLVLTPRPGRLSHLFEIPLPRPRTLEMMFEPDFHELVQQIKSTVESSVGRTKEEE